MPDHSEGRIQIVSALGSENSSKFLTTCASERFSVLYGDISESDIIEVREYSLAEHSI